MPTQPELEKLVERALKRELAARREQAAGQFADELRAAYDAMLQPARAESDQALGRRRDAIGVLESERVRERRRRAAMAGG